MFESMSQWGWVSFSWGHLVVSYVAYLLYLNWRVKRLEDEAEASSSNG